MSTLHVNGGTRQVMAEELRGQRLQDRIAGMRDALIAVGMLQGDGIHGGDRIPALDVAEQAIVDLIARAERGEAP